MPKAVELNRPSNQQLRNETDWQLLRDTVKGLSKMHVWKDSPSARSPWTVEPRQFLMLQFVKDWVVVPALPMYTPPPEFVSWISRFSNVPRTLNCCAPSRGASSM